jgi:hypothetical protein
MSSIAILVPEVDGTKCVGKKLARHAAGGAGDPAAVHAMQAFRLPRPRERPAPATDFRNILTVVS